MPTSVLDPEAGIFYGVCWIVVIVRLISRRLHRGSWKLLQADDYLILVAMATDTVLITIMHKVAKTSSNLIPPGDDVSTYSEEEIRGRIYGSKLVLAVEQMQLTTIWLIKACLLIMYNRMTMVLPQHKVVVWTAIYVGVSFVIMEVLYLGVWCRPFNQYWAVPPSSKQCSAATNHLITNAIFNISSDLIIICIPMPLLFKVRLPKKTKCILFFIFCIGAFTIVAAALNKYYSFTHPFGTEWTIWYLRESYTAILCANLPLTYPLIQRIFKLRNWNSYTYGGNETNYGAPSTRPPPTHSSQHTRVYWPEPDTPHIPRGFRDIFKRTESQEEINGGLGKQREDVDTDPQFLTSAIELEATKEMGGEEQVGKPLSCRTSASGIEGIRNHVPFDAV
ncbi:family decarboxylase [Pyrenophora seminiperda CCB06]|uniref:Family decarboxylase n=1 Tax=Pyrenophora seminiperda CCB06 TaxID=1302712 RepID=A0A3M7LXK5_9PLEO|nr:family decarboxylase [Pyrenophora seminiperda CCB06]